jgi:Sulfotransferase family
MQAQRQLYLCGGLQSSGSTLISWCFLQRPDTDGVLDARFDMLPTLPPITVPNPWIKFTIACFRFSEVMEHFQFDGWTIKPLLVVRDVRSVFNSLIQKSYGRNGTTADDPPLRLRLRRFKDDWQLFRDRGWPMLRYESLVADPKAVLTKACEEIGLPWHDGMMHWTKSPDEIAAATYGNENFIRDRKSSLTDTLDPGRLKTKTENIPPADLEWMEKEFADMNVAMDYPAHLPVQNSSAERAVPQFQLSRRYARLVRQNSAKRLLRKVLGKPELSPEEFLKAVGVPSTTNGPTASGTTPDAAGQ